MREILFRGKVTNDGEWICGNLVVGSGQTEIFIADQWYHIDPATVGQSTGIFDKNDVKIFEGDIVLVETYPTPCEVKFCQGDWVIDTGEIWTFPARNIDCEVIGNIHDNPELLEGLQ
jgi:uncharacterized phage protein (TIGR01671 family)